MLSRSALAFAWASWNSSESSMMPFANPSMSLDRRFFAWLS